MNRVFGFRHKHCRFHAMCNAVWHAFSRLHLAFSRLACHINLVVVAAGADSDSALGITLDWLVASDTSPSISSAPLIATEGQVAAGVGAATAATEDA